MAETNVKDVQNQNLGEEKKENETPQPAEAKKEEPMKKEPLWKKILKFAGIGVGGALAIGGAFLLGSKSGKKKYSDVPSRPAEIPAYPEPESDSVPYAEDADFVEVEE